MLTPSQIKWAASHDWFVADCLDGTIYIRDRYVFEGKLFEQIILWNEGFRTLRDWAGY